MAAYEEVSVLRDRHSAVIWDQAPAGPAELRAILADLDQGLAQLDEPLRRDLAEGNVYLRYRRFNFLVDKVKVHARLGETDAALAAWDELNRIAWTPGTAMFDSDPHVARLRKEPRAAPILAQHEIASRWGRAPAFDTPYAAELPVAERIAGLSMVWSIARDGFVWFDRVPGLDWDRAYLDALPRVIAATRTADYYRELIRFVALLQDGHSNVYPPDELSYRFWSRPGIRTERIEGRVLVTRLIDPSLAAQGLKIGDEVLTIDDVPVARHAAESVAPYVSSSTPQDLAVRTYSYSLLAGPADRPVKLGLQHAGGERYTIVAPRAGYTPAAAAPTERFELRSDGIAVLEARQFSDARAAGLLEANLDALAEAKGLIVDLRGNGGGSSNHGWEVLSYTSAAPIPTLASSYRESTAYGRASKREHADIEWRKLPAEPYRSPHERIFEGPVALLIDARTFSAAEDTAAAFRLMRRGIVVGTASGGSTGQPLLFDLPGGGTARICVKRDTYPDGSHFVGVGVLPDIEVTATVASVRAGADPVLERAVEALLSDGPARRKQKPAGTHP